MAIGLQDYARAVPLNALTAYGFGPLGKPGSKPGARLASLRTSTQGVWAAIDTAGLIGRQLLTVVAALGSSASREQLEFQTAPAAAGVLDDGLARLVAAGLVTTEPDGRVELAPAIRQSVPGATISLADQQAITSDELALICRAVGVKPPGRKQGRIDAIERTFADPVAAGRIRGELSVAARGLLDRIVAEAGAGETSPESIGVDGYLLRSARARRYSYQRAPQVPEAAALFELTSRGIVGFAEWEARLWVWREAWPLVARPFLSNWTTRPAPQVVAVASDSGTRLPAVVGALDHLMRVWQATPPAALKNGEARVAKGDVRAASKTLRVDEAVVEIASRLAISIGLVLRNVVGRSGRGRNARVEEVWLGDPAMTSAWETMAPLARWARLVAEWCSPRIDCGHQLLVNRHLVLWELAQLPDDRGYADAAEFADWFEERFASLGVAEAALECIVDLQALGVVTAGPLALTRLGRAVLDEPATVTAMGGSGATTVTIQADLTVIAPPDLRHELMVGLDSVAELENASGAMTYRIDAGRVTRAVQGGQTPAGIVELLAGIASTPLPDTVVRLVHDAAARAGAVRVIAAPTVVVVSDGADLVTACAVKALKLIRLTDTVAITDVPLPRVRTALERKGLAPEAIVGGAAPAARSSVDDAARAAKRAAEVRAMSGGRPGGVYEQHARQLEERAATMGDVAGRLDVRAPLTMTPSLLDRL